MNRFLCALFIALACILPVPLRSEETEISSLKKAVPAAAIFSGTVSALTPEKLTVVRKVLGRDAVTRAFVLDPETKIEGKLQVRARVTVRYRALEEGGLAAEHIIVR